MSSSRESPFRSFAAAIGQGIQKLSTPVSYDDADQEWELPEGPDGKPGKSRLTSLLDDLKTSELEYEARRSGQPVEQPKQTEAAPAQAEPEGSSVEPVTVAPNGATKLETVMPDEVVRVAPEPTNGSLTAAQQVIAQQRKAAEALLSEVCALEARLKEEAKAAQAAEIYEAAKKKAEGAALLEQRAKELAQATSERHSALAAEGKAAEGLLVATRAQADAAQARVADLERQLRDAQTATKQTMTSLTEHEVRAKERAAKESAAEREAGEAAARLAACEAACEAAKREAKAAGDRADALKKELPTSTAGLAGVTEVQTLAARLAEQASALTNGS
jgi:hypothetical protein